MRDILGDDEAQGSLLDPEQSLAEALAIRKASSATDWLRPTKTAFQALDRMAVEALKNLDRDGIKPLMKLYEAVKERLDDWMNLTGEKLDL